jgi:hypothetical protein
MRTDRKKRRFLLAAGLIALGTILPAAAEAAVRFCAPRNAFVYDTKFWVRPALLEPCYANCYKFREQLALWPQSGPWVCAEFDAPIVPGAIWCFRSERGVLYVAESSGDVIFRPVRHLPHGYTLQRGL